MPSLSIYNNTISNTETATHGQKFGKSDYKRVTRVLLPPISMTRYLTFFLLRTVPFPYADCWQCIEAASGSKAITME